MEGQEGAADAQTGGLLGLHSAQGLAQVKGVALTPPRGRWIFVPDDEDSSEYDSVAAVDGRRKSRGSASDTTRDTLLAENYPHSLPDSEKHSMDIAQRQRSLSHDMESLRSAEKSLRRATQSYLDQPTSRGGNFMAFTHPSAFQAHRRSSEPKAYTPSRPKKKSSRSHRPPASRRRGSGLDQDEANHRAKEKKEALMRIISDTLSHLATATYEACQIAKSATEQNRIATSASATSSAASFKVAVAAASALLSTTTAIAALSLYESDSEKVVNDDTDSAGASLSDSDQGSGDDEFDHGGLETRSSPSRVASVDGIGGQSSDPFTTDQSTAYTASRPSPSLPAGPRRGNGRFRGGGLAYGHVLPSSLAKNIPQGHMDEPLRKSISASSSYPAANTSDAAGSGTQSWYRDGSGPKLNSVQIGTPNRYSDIRSPRLPRVRESPTTIDDIDE